jgi:glycosyltransferase involved in cell wall biosynthesis
MKILWSGPVFSPTGIGTANREMVKELSKLPDVQIQVRDTYHSHYDCNEGLSHLNNAIDVKKGEVFTIFSDYPMHWREGYGTIIGHPIHEGTKIPEGWSELINVADKIFVCSSATKNLFKYNGVIKPTKVINYGFNPELYNTEEQDRDAENFLFLSVNSWTGEKNDRKGTDLLLKAFDEEFKPEEKVKLLLKVSTFWQNKISYAFKVAELLGHINPNILINDEYVSEKELADHYKNSDCFVAPTRGEGFGLTILNSLACGCPVIVTQDENSGHMDFCRGNEGVIWIKSEGLEQGDPRFFVKGNMLSRPSLKGLRQAMRYAFENRKEMRERGKLGSEFVKDMTWKKCAEGIYEYLKNGGS